jgi:hypothetical protein
MALAHQYTLICDDVRQENNGKFLILGMYTGNITVTQLPFGLPTLTFFQMLMADRLGGYTVRVQLQNVESGRVLAQAIVMMEVNQAPNGLPVPVLNIPKFGNVLFDRAGAYSLNVTIDGQADPIIVPFDVVLNIQMGPQAGQPPQPGPRR